jgi:hypothetical protein
MAKVPEPLHSTAALIYQAYENDADSGNRPHLGASLIGHACERYLWMTFRWVESKKFPGRMLRLFETGQLEEARFVANLRRIGIEVHDVDATGNQWRVSDIGGHFGGSMDGAARGFPEAPKTWHVVEFKTHSEKSFKELSKGVQTAKPQHYAQMQVYMGLTGMDRAFYMAVNKNTDELYTERVEFDQVEFARLKARAERVINAAEPPLKISEDPSWYVCKMCDFHEHCHGQAAPQVNCRTCAHSTPMTEGEVGEWICESKLNTITIDAQRTGCSSHRYIPILLQNFATQTDYVNGDVVYTDKDGVVFGNGDNPGSLRSKEIRSLRDKSVIGGFANFKSDLDAVFGPGSEVIG